MFCFTGAHYLMHRIVSLFEPNNSTLFLADQGHSSLVTGVCAIIILLSAASKTMHQECQTASAYTFYITYLGPEATKHQLDTRKTTGPTDKSITGVSIQVKSCFILQPNDLKIVMLFLTPILFKNQLHK